jgi:hypothetical protein
VSEDKSVGYDIGFWIGQTLGDLVQSPWTYLVLFVLLIVWLRTRKIR